MPYSHLTLDERVFLQVLLENKESLRRIASLMGRSPSTISREIRRNSGRNGYHALPAYKKARKRRRKGVIRVLVPGSPAFQYVEEKLQLFWSPETICGRWGMDHPEESTLHYSTIYRHIKQGYLPGISEKQHLRRRGKKPRAKRGGQMTIHPNRLIRDWPDEIKNRTRIGDWEGDTITGKIGSGLITTLVDRKSRFLVAGKVPNKYADTQRTAIEALLSGKEVTSISFDNGVEFAEHEAIEKTLDTTVYFADPHCPWQRGSNENINGLLRFFFPRSSDFRAIDQEDVARVVELLNGRPRKCLEWSTPAEVFFGVALT